jgi:hypothetical protein
MDYLKLNFMRHIISYPFLVRPAGGATLTGGATMTDATDPPR